MIRVLMIGKSNKTMAKMAMAMGSDFRVDYSENTPDALSNKQGQDFDAVVLGRALPDQARQVFNHILLAQNPNLVVVKSLGPIGELVAAQVKQALFEKSGTEPMAQDITYSKQGVTFTLKATAKIHVTRYSTNIFFKTTTAKIINDQLDEGRHSIHIQKGFLAQTYVSISCDDELHLIKL